MHVLSCVGGGINARSPESGHTDNIIHYVSYSYTQHENESWFSHESDS